MNNQRHLAFSILTLFAALLISACQSEPPAPTATPTPDQPTATPTDLPFKAVGTDISIELPVGDELRGEEQAKFRGCLACHGTGLGPHWTANEEMPGIGERAESRYSQENYTGAATSAQQYLFESIVQPSAHVVEGFSDGVMISQSSVIMSGQDVADVISFLLTLR